VGVEMTAKITCPREESLIVGWYEHLRTHFLAIIYKHQHMHFFIQHYISLEY